MKTKGERHKKPQLNYNLFFHITHKTNRPQLTKPMTTTKSQTPEREWNIDKDREARRDRKNRWMAFFKKLYTQEYGREREMRLVKKWMLYFFQYTQRYKRGRHEKERKWSDYVFQHIQYRKEKGARGRE
jgi:hypothetical protein